jgi:ribosomal protein L34
MHYPQHITKKPRASKVGFRSRITTTNGRKTINRKRRAGRKVQVV